MLEQLRAIERIVIKSEDLEKEEAPYPGIYDLRHIQAERIKIILGEWAKIEGNVLLNKGTHISFITPDGVKKTEVNVAFEPDADIVSTTYGTKGDVCIYNARSSYNTNTKERVGNYDTKLNAGNINTGVDAENISTGRDAVNISTGRDARNHLTGENAVNVYTVRHATNTETLGDSLNFETGGKARNIETSGDEENLWEGGRVRNFYKKILNKFK